MSSGDLVLITKENFVVMEYLSEKSLQISKIAEGQYSGLFIHSKKTLKLLQFKIFTLYNISANFVSTYL